MQSHLGAIPVAPIFHLREPNASLDQIVLEFYKVEPEQELMMINDYK